MHGDVRDEVVIGMHLLGVKKSKQKGGLVANTCNTSTQEKKAGLWV